mgnify:CR=1 FL=1
MKFTKSQLLQIIKEELNEVTQGEMEFAELEAARQNFIENRGDDEAISDLLYKVEQLVEPLMMEMGLYFEVQELLNNGDIVFTNDRNMEVRIDPRGAMGRYDVQVNPLHDAHDSFDPVEISLDSMKGVVQYIKDEFREELQRGGTYKQPPMGMVGEPEGQMELPLPRESKMRITKSQLQQVIKEALQEEMGSFAMAEDVIELLGSKYNVMEEDVPATLMAMAKSLQDAPASPSADEEEEDPMGDYNYRGSRFHY